MNERLPAGAGHSRGVRTRSPSGPGLFTPRAESFDGDEIQLQDLWVTIKRRRWTVVFTTMLFALSALVYTIWVTPVWSANTLILIEDKQTGQLISSELMALTGVRGGGSQIETEERILQTRSIAEDVVDDHDLNFVVAAPKELPRDLLFSALEFGRETSPGEYRIRTIGSGLYELQTTGGDAPRLDVEFAPGDTVRFNDGYFVLADLDRTDPGGAFLPTEIDVEMFLFREAVEDYFEHGISVGRPAREANILQVSYRTTDRTLAHQVPNSHAENFIIRRNESHKVDARSTVAFLEGRLEATQEQLESVESQLADFREGEQIIAVEAEAEAQVERMATLQTRRTQLDAERSALRQLLSDIDSEAEDPDYRRLATFPTFFQNQAVTGMLSSLIQADSARSSLLVNKTPNHPDVVAVEERIEELEAQLGSIGRNYLGSLSDQITAIDTVLAQFSAELEEVPERQLEFARIQRQVDMLAELYTILRTRLEEAEVQEAIDDSSIRVVEEAVEPLEPESPRPISNLATASILGLVLGVALAFVREYTDRRLHSTDRIETLYGLPTMARIPVMAGGDGRDARKRALVTLDERQSVAAESFRTLRTNIRFTPRGDDVERIVVTSPSTNEGKSLTAANLAITMAQKGRRTLLVDADMRRSVQHEHFEVSRSPGLADCLLSGQPPADAIAPTKLDTLFVLPVGRSVPNPAELLDGPEMDHLLDALRADYDALILDTPPVLAVTDAAVLAPKTDGVILVVRAEKTDKDAIGLAIQQMRQVDAEILGVVVNDAKAEGSYQSYYREYYGQTRSTGLKGLIDRVTGVFS